MKSKQRHDGGAFRRMKTMVSYHAKPGKDRSAAKRKQQRKDENDG